MILQIYILQYKLQIYFRFFCYTEAIYVKQRVADSCRHSAQLGFYMEKTTRHLAKTPGHVI